MSEPAAIWSCSRLIVFDKDISLIHNVILSHARFALQDMVTRIDRLHAIVAASQITNAYVDPDIPSILTDICFYQGVASTILFNDAPKSSKENNESYRLRRERIAYVRKVTVPIKFPVLEDRKIRNSLTHVDEYLTKALTAPDTGWMIDSAIADRHQFQAPVGKIAFCRTYIASEDVIVHLGYEISLKQLRREAKTALKLIWAEDETDIKYQPVTPRAR